MSEKGKNGNENIVCNELIFSTQKTCEFFGISRETLSSWQKKGAPKESRGKWNLKKLVEWRFDGGHKESPEVRKLKAEADLKEAKAQQEKCRLSGREIEQVLHQDVARVLGPGKAHFDQGEAGLHEHDQNGRDQGPEQIGIGL